MSTHSTKTDRRKIKVGRKEYGSIFSIKREQYEADDTDHLSAEDLAELRAAMDAAPKVIIAPRVHELTTLAGKLHNATVKKNPAQQSGDWHLQRAMKNADSAISFLAKAHEGRLDEKDAWLAVAAAMRAQGDFMRAYIADNLEPLALIGRAARNTKGGRPGKDWAEVQALADAYVKVHPSAKKYQVAQYLLRQPGVPDTTIGTLEKRFKMPLKKAGNVS